MTTGTNKQKTIRILHIIAAMVLAASFFMPWVLWDGAAVKGIDMPSGSFFKVAEEKSGIENPFPGLSFAFYIFLLIPAFAVMSVAANMLNKNIFWLSVIAGALSLSLMIVYYLFTKSISENGLISKSSQTVWMLLQVIAALLIILTAGLNKWTLKAGLIFLTIVGTYFGFKIVSGKLEKEIMSEGHQATSQAKTDYTLTADILIKEFLTNDTTSNKKYREKMLEVNGVVNSAEIAADSTSTLKFADTTGSYAIFSVEKTELEKMKGIKAGDVVTVKGVCSGSIFSDILGTTSINFKRSVIKQKQ